MLSEEETERVRLVENKYEASLFRDPLVLGVGVGAADDNPAEGVVAVMVWSGRWHQSIPSRLDGIRTKVIPSTLIKPQAECSSGTAHDQGKGRARPR
jgi:hypothetical protein